MKIALGGSNINWLRQLAARVPSSALSFVGVPSDLAGLADRVMSYLHDLRRGKGARRCTLVLLGPQAAGKTSLLWRLQHPDPVKYPLKDRGSTNGIVMGTTHAYDCARQCMHASVGVLVWLTGTCLLMAQMRGS